MKPNDQRARSAIIFLICAMTMDVIRSTMHVYMLFITENDIDYFNQLLTYTKYLSYLHAMVNLLTSIFFILWFRRAYFNLHFLGVPGLRYAEGWAAGAWFVPVMQLFVPYKIMNDIWIDTQRAIFNGKDYKEKPIISLWWACWIIGFLLERALYFLYTKAITLEDFHTAHGINIVSNFFNFTAGILLIMIIKELSVYENELFQSKTNTDTSVLYDVLSDTDQPH